MDTAPRNTRSRAKAAGTPLISLEDVVRQSSQKPVPAASARKALFDVTNTEVGEPEVGDIKAAGTEESPSKLKATKAALGGPTSEINFGSARTANSAAIDDYSKFKPGQTSPPPITQEESASLVLPPFEQLSLSSLTDSPPRAGAQTCSPLELSKTVPAACHGSPAADPEGRLQLLMSDVHDEPEAEIGAEPEQLPSSRQPLASTSPQNHISLTSTGTETSNNQLFIDAEMPLPPPSPAASDIKIDRLQAAKSLQVPSDPSRPEGIVDRWQLGHGSDVDSPAPASPVWVLPAQPRPDLDPAMRPRSTITMASPDRFDPRSIRQLKKEVKAALLQRDITRNPTSGPAQTQSSESATTTDLAEEEDDEGISSDICAALSSLEISHRPDSAPGPLKGLPLYQGRHTRFTESDAATPIDSPQRPVLRGMPPATGSHLRFDDSCV